MTKFHKIGILSNLEPDNLKYCGNSMCVHGEARQVLVRIGS